MTVKVTIECEESDAVNVFVTVQEIGTDGKPAQGPDVAATTKLAPNVPHNFYVHSTLQLRVHEAKKR